VGYEHWVPDDTCSKEVIAIFSSPDYLTESAVAENCAEAVILIALLSSVEHGCQSHGQAEEGSEGRKLHRFLVTSVGRTKLMSTATNQRSLEQPL